MLIHKYIKKLTVMEQYQNNVGLQKIHLFEFGRVYAIMYLQKHNLFSGCHKQNNKLLQTIFITNPPVVVSQVQPIKISKYDTEKIFCDQSVRKIRRKHFILTLLA